MNVCKIKYLNNKNKSDSTRHRKYQSVLQNILKDRYIDRQTGAPVEVPPVLKNN